MNAEQLKIVLDQLGVVQEILVIAQADAAAESVKQTSQTLADWHALLSDIYNTTSHGGGDRMLRYDLAVDVCKQLSTAVGE